MRKIICAFYILGNLLVATTSSAQSLDFHTPAHKKGISPKVLEGICRYESDSGRLKVNHNRNGSWDVGFCQNHRGVSKRQPKIPADQASIREASKEAQYWHRQHERFCINHYAETGECGSVIYGKWRGVKNCQRPHFWWSHYNHGFRVLKNNYDRKVACFIKNGFKKCSKQEWKQIKHADFKL